MNKVDNFFKLFDEVTSSYSIASTDRALYLLLLKFKDELPEFDSSFHKSFRQWGVTDDSKVDMAIWHLLASSELFWDCFQKINENA